MPEFDAVSQFAGRPLFSSQMQKRLFELAQELSLTHGTHANKIKRFKKNKQGQYIDKDGNVVDVGGIDFEKINPQELARIMGLSVEDTIKNRNEFGLGKGLVPEEVLAPYQRYTKERFEGFSPAQDALRDEADQFAVNANQSSVKPELQSLGQVGSIPDEIVDSSKKFMTPYQDLFKAWEEQAQDKFKKRLEREINPQFISSGTWGSGGHRKFQHEALQENEKHLRHAQIEHLAKATGQSLENAAKAVEGRHAALRDVNDIENNAFKKSTLAFDIRNQLAAQRQALGQKQKDYAYQEFNREKDHADQVLDRLSNRVMGYQANVPTETMMMNVGTNPNVSQPSMNSVLGGFGMMGTGMLGKQAHMAPFAEGGSVQEKHYGAGGQTSYLGPQRVSSLDIVKAKVNKNHSRGIPDLFANAPLEMSRPSPTDQDININTPEIDRIRQHASNLQNTPHTPFWDALGGFGAGMLRSKGKNTLEMLQGGGAEAWDTFNKSHADREAREDKITNLNSAIQQTRQIQMDREMKYRHERDSLNIDKIKANAVDRRENQRIGLEEKRIEQEERKMATREAIELAKINSREVKKENLTADQRKSDKENDVKIAALKDAYQDYKAMKELAPDIYTGPSSKWLPNALVDEWLPGSASTEGKQSDYDKLAESAAQNRARAKFGNSRITNSELKSAQKTVPYAHLPKSGINKVIDREKQRMKDQLKDLLKQRNLPYEGDLSMFEEDNDQKSSNKEDENSSSSSNGNDLVAAAQAELKRRKAA